MCLARRECWFELRVSREEVSRLNKSRKTEELRSGTNKSVFGPFRLGVEQYSVGKAFIFSKQMCWHKELCSDN